MSVNLLVLKFQYNEKRGNFYRKVIYFSKIIFLLYTSPPPVIRR